MNQVQIQTQVAKGATIVNIRVKKSLKKIVAEARALVIMKKKVKKNQNASIIKKDKVAQGLEVEVEVETEVDLHKRAEVIIIDHQ